MGHGLFFPSGPEAGFDGDPKTLVELYASKSLKGAMVGFGSSPDANVLDGGFLDSSGADAVPCAPM